MTADGKGATLITGAAGNLGGLLARHLLRIEGGSTTSVGSNVERRLNLMVHKTRLAPELEDHPAVTAFPADLARPETLDAPCRSARCLVHFAGVLFKPRPERFLPTTNTVYFRNLVDAALEQGVRRIILISFPHVEGETTPHEPARGSLEGQPSSWHARTRLEEEKYLFSATEGTGVEPVSLRLGMVYGRGILMVDTARWLARRWLLGVWRRPTWIHLISTLDYLRCVEAAVTSEGVSGIYHVGDEGRITLQEFLDRAAAQWGVKKPWRMPVWMIFTAAWLCELFAGVLGTRSPLTRDFVRIGMESYYGDTERMRAELLPELTHKSLEEGISTL